MQFSASFWCFYQECSLTQYETLIIQRFQCNRMEPGFGFSTTNNDNNGKNNESAPFIKLPFIRNPKFVHCWVPIGFQHKNKFLWVNYHVHQKICPQKCYNYYLIDSIPSIESNRWRVTSQKRTLPHTSRWYWEWDQTMCACGVFPHRISDIARRWRNCTTWMATWTWKIIWI